MVAESRLYQNLARRRTHLSAVLDGLLFATEAAAIAEARRVAASKRARYATTAHG